MPHTEICVKHKLAVKEVIERLKNDTENLLDEFSDKIVKSEYGWNKNNATFSIWGPMGVKIAGTIFVELNYVIVEFEFPTIGRLYIKEAKRLIKERLNKVLKPQRS